MKTFKKVLAVVLSTLMAFSVLAVSVFAEGTEPEVITNVEITVAAPVEGEYASADCLLETENVTVAFLQWTDYYTDEILFSTDAEAEVTDSTYEADGSYVVGITLTADEGYVFDSAENLVISVNGYAAELVEITEDSGEISFTCIFDCESVDTDVDDGGAGVSISFDQILSVLKSALLAFVRFIGTLLGL